MRVGIPREIKDNEYRVAITPAGVNELSRAGHQVYVEKDAGVGSALPDETFTRAGAKDVGRNLPGQTVFTCLSHDVVVHETTDPEVIVAEYDYSGESLTTGKSFEAANIQVLRIRDGLIVFSRDYHDYLKITAARDGLAQLAEAAEQANAALELPPLPERPVSTAAPDSPRGVFEQLAYGVSDGKWHELPELYAEETHVTHPFLPGSPTLKTRKELREHFALGAASATQLQARDLVVHESTDPEVIVGEFDYQGTSGIGRPFRVSSIFVLRVRDGLIVESRDYSDHLALAAASGRLAELTARL